MTLDIDKYRINIPFIETYINNQPNMDFEAELTILAASKDIPIIAVCYYMGELYGFNTRLLNKINRLKIFYNVSNIIGHKIIVD